MLISLGINAVLGVSLVLIDDSDALIRTTLTSVLLTCALALLLGGANATASSRFTAFGLGLIGSVLAQFPLGLLAIWSQGLPNMLMNRVLASWTLLFWLSIPFCTALILIGYRPTRYTGRLAAAGTLASTLILLTTMWASWNTYLTFGLPIAAAFAIATCAWLGSLSLITRSKRLTPWQYLGVLLSACTACLWIYVAHQATSNNIDFPGTLAFNLTMAFGLGTLLIGIVAICRAIQLARGTSWIRLATIAATTAAVVLQEAALIVDANWPDDLSSRLAISAWILTGCCLMAMCVMAWRSSWDRANHQTGRMMSIQCPACGRRQKRPLGESTCDRCEQPLWLWCRMVTCPECHYDLSGAASPQCPECGLDIGVPTDPPPFVLSGNTGPRDSRTPCEPGTTSFLPNRHLDG